MDKLKEAHDNLLADEAQAELHKQDLDLCPFCNPQLTLETQERGDMETFNQEQVDAAVNAATAPLLAELEALKAGLAENEVEAKIAAAKAEAEEQVKAAQKAVDDATLRADSAEAELTNLKAYLEQVAAETAEAEAAEARKEARIAQLKEKTSFSDATIDARIGEWAKLSDEDFEARLAEWSELSGPKSEEAAKVAETAMKTVRTEGGAKPSLLARAKATRTEAADAGVLNRI